MERALLCPACQQTFPAQLRSDELAEYVLCAHCNNRFLFDPTGAPPDLELTGPAAPRVAAPPATAAPSDYAPPPQPDLVVPEEAPESGRIEPPPDPSARRIEPGMEGPSVGNIAWEEEAPAGMPQAATTPPPSPYMAPEGRPVGTPTAATVGAGGYLGGPGYGAGAQSGYGAEAGYATGAGSGYGWGQGQDSGYDWGSGAPAASQSEHERQEQYVMLFPTTSRPLVGGIILFIAAAIALGNVIYLMDQHTEQNSEEVASYLNQRLGWDIDWQDYHSAMNKVYIGLTLLALGGFVGAIMSMLRLSYSLAIIGTIMCIVAMGPFFLSTLLAVVALWLITTSRSQFQSHANETPALGPFAD